jgi:hypothetical protein
VGRRNKNEESSIRKEVSLKGLYHVEAQIKDSETREYRTIMCFHAIIAYGKEDAIYRCKEIMSKYVGELPRYKWVVEAEWENNPHVN